MNKKKILLTFDYELFFGSNSGTFEKSMYEPTEKILDICKTYDVNVTFFIDILYYEKLYLEGLKDTANQFKIQLKRMIDEGHRVELHLHPHWLDAIWQDDQWHFPTYRYYRLHALPQKLMEETFNNAYNLLQNICSEIDPNYKVLAYRAGGWCIQPFELLHNLFLSNNLFIDSSVAYGMQGKSDTHVFDFTTIPNKSFYNYSYNVDQIDKEGPFLEVPISVYQVTLFNKIMRKIKKKIFPSLFKQFGDGSAISFKTVKSYFNKYEMISLESLSYRKICAIIDTYEHDIINVISHPKGMSKYSFAVFEKLLQSQKYQYITFEYKDFLVSAQINDK